MGSGRNGEGKRKREEREQLRDSPLTLSERDGHAV
jgi:hypothetical protein